MHLVNLSIHVEIFPEKFTYKYLTVLQMVSLLYFTSLFPKFCPYKHTMVHKKSKNSSEKTSQMCYDNSGDVLLQCVWNCVQTDEKEKFLMPLLSNQVGAGNQLMEYISAAVIARAINRTLCLSPFWPGPSVHAGK